jgi:hypothetical protein
VRGTLPQIVILSSILSLFFLLFAFRKRSRIGFPMFIIAAVLATAAYGGLFIAVQPLSEGAAEQLVSSPFRSGYIYPIGDYLFYSEELRHTSGDELPRYRPFLLISPYTHTPRASMESHRAISLYRSAALDGAERSLILGETIYAGGEPSRGSARERTSGGTGSDGAAAEGGEAPPATGNGKRDLIPLRTGKESLLSSSEPPELIATIAHEAQLASRNLLALLEKGLPYFAAAVLVHVLYVIFSWACIRTSPWPMFNALVGLFLLRLFFYIHRITTGDAVRSLMAGFPIEGYGKLLPTGAVGAITILFVLWSIAFYAGKRERS